MTVTVWKPIPGFEGFYEVSNTGEIKSLRSGKIRKPVYNRHNGYNYVVLHGEDYKRTLSVHRIVAKAFVENPFDYGFVNHIDENKLNNKAENLEWCTQAYNNTYNGKTQRCCKPIVQTDHKTKDKVIWSSAREAHNAGIANYKNISACCRGLRHTAGGYEWGFLNWEK